MNTAELIHEKALELMKLIIEKLPDSSRAAAELEKTEAIVVPLAILRISSPEEDVAENRDSIINICYMSFMCGFAAASGIDLPDARDDILESALEELLGSDESRRQANSYLN